MDREEFDRYFGLDRWPVTVHFDGKVSVKFESDRIRAEWNPVLREYGSIGEAEDVLLRLGFEPCGFEVCRHHLRYRKDDGFAWIMFAPACIYEDFMRQEVSKGMDRMFGSTYGA